MNTSLSPNTNIAYWTAVKSVELTDRDMRVDLYSNKQLNGLKLVQFYGSGPGIANNQINLHGHTFSIGGGGLINASEEETKIVDGYLTAHAGTINITNTVDTTNELFIGAVITNNQGSRVSLTITRDSDWASSKKRIVALGGNQPNTFTGETTITLNNVLRLKKDKGATAISGDLRINQGATVELYKTHQINRSARVVLFSAAGYAASEIVFKGEQGRNLTENIHQLVVEGTGKIDFGGESYRGEHSLYLDDLEIKEGGRLIIENWKEGRDYLLVRKDSKHLQDSLKRIEFADGRKWGDLVDAGGMYYSISNAPEPAVFGAGIMALGLGALAWRRKHTAKPSA